jgi:hypothetical protein
MNAIRDEIENEASRLFAFFFQRSLLTRCVQVEAVDRRSSTMGFIWAGARALRRTHLGRFMKLRSDTAWLEGTLFEMDNPGQSGDILCFVFIYDLFIVLDVVNFFAAPKRLKPTENETVVDDSKPTSLKAEADAAVLAAATQQTPAEALVAAEPQPEVVDSSVAATSQ